MQKALALLIPKERTVVVYMQFRCEYSHITLIESILSSHNAVQVDAEFSHNILITVEVDARVSDRVADEIFSRTRGQVTVSKLQK